jgi:uncharacterized protein YegP (UPF0339 family)
MAKRCFFQLRKDANDKWRWSFYTAGGQHLAVSGESYDTEGDCRSAIAVLASRAASAVIHTVPH